VRYDISHVLHPYLDTKDDIIVLIFHNRQYIDINKMEINVSKLSPIIMRT
jgi:hypothetical protein